MKGLKAFVLAVTASLAFSANAGLLSVSGGADYLIPSNNDLFYDGVTTYNIGGNVYLDELADLSFTYLGHEAGYSNDFNAYGDTLNNKTNAVGDSFAATGVLAGLLDFNFYSYGGGTGSVTNGANNPIGATRSFAVLLDYWYMGDYYDAILLFDDSGAGPDDNHDDHVIGVKAVAVPAPATILLLGLGLLGLGDGGGIVLAHLAHQRAQLLHIGGGSIAHGQAALSMGSRTRNSEPRPTSLLTSMSPPCSCTMLRAIANPRPVPSPSTLVVK